jgi:hypothetical protein
MVHDGHGHAVPGLAHHFDTLEQQREATTLGMWVFLVTEVLFFGGLFVVYAVYRNWYPEAFAAASHELDVMLGGINTAVLITSSLTMALAVHAAQTGKRNLVMLFLIATMLLGGVFLGIKSVEYYQQVRRASHSRTAVRVRRKRTGEARAAVLFALFPDDRLACAAHGDRVRHHAVDVVVDVSRHDHQRVLQPDRNQRTVLALRRHRLDLPVPVALPAGSSWRTLTR